jgi:FkbM family methyltransferase
MQRITYAQNREDVVLNRAFGDQACGFYIDIGANDPTKCSITRHFYDLGWHGINVEPGKAAFQQLVRARRRDLNLNIGISHQSGTLTFFECPATSTLSTFSAKEAGLLREQGIVFEERRVPVLTLAQMFGAYVRTTVDFLSIDVEHHEREVIEGGDWRYHRPRVVVVEDCSPWAANPRRAGWESLLLDADFHFALFDGLNRFYVRGEDKHLVPVLSVPANVLDDFIVHDYLEGVGPTGLAVARRLHALALRLPRMSAVAHWLGYLTYRGMKKVSAAIPFLKSKRRSRRGADCISPGGSMQGGIGRSLDGSSH